MINKIPLILIVDDNQMNLKVLGTILMEENYEIILAGNGKEAVHEAKTNHPDIILMDVMMPEMNGLEATKILKKDDETKNIPVIFITAIGEESTEEEGFRIGAADYINKPVRGPIVRARVKAHLELHNQKKYLEQKVLERTEELKKKNEELEETRFEIIKRLGKAAEFKDNETGNHILRMSRISAIMAKGLGLTKAECDLILQASPMHDIGKIGIPDNILLKKGRLDTDEWAIMQSHVYVGAEILKGNNSKLLNTAVEIVLTHHERWDGNGYPKGIKGEQIPLFGRICAVADVFDALTSKRPYKEAWPVAKAVSQIRNEKGKHFQPELVDVFIENLPEIIEISNHFSD